MTVNKPTSGKLEDGVHYFPLRVYIEDTDATGIVYHARYLTFFERARTELLRLLGIEQSGYLREPKENYLSFAVRRLSIDYKAPAKLDDVLTVTSRLTELRGALVKIDQSLARGEDALAQARIEVAAVGANGRARRLPKEMRRLFMATMEAHAQAG